MSVIVAVDRVACNTSGGNQAIAVSAGGLTPKAALFILVGATVDGAPASDVIFSQGAATGTANRWVNGMYSKDGVTTSKTQGWFFHDSCIKGYDGDTTLLFDADFVSFGADTVTINWATAPASAWFLTVVTFSGSGVSAHANFKDVLNTVDLEINVTDPGFEPDILFTAFANSFDPGTGTHGISGYGIVHSDGAGGVVQRSTHFYEQNARVTTRASSRNSTLGGIVQGAGTTLDNYIEYKNFDSSGFSMFSRINGGNNREHQYLALSFGGEVSSWVGTYWTPTSPGEDSEAGPGFKPQFLFTWNSFMETIDADHNYDSGLGGQRGMSAITEASQFSNSFNSDSGVSMTDAKSLSDNIAIELPDEDGSAGLTATLVSFDTNGWTLDYSAVEGVAKLFFALAIEEEAPAGYTSPFPAFRAP